jgi:cold shock CspA family protein
VTSGTVKRVEADSGSGLIAAEDGNEYYFHRGGIKRPLEFDDLFGGERVSFEIETQSQGPRAIQVSRSAPVR